MDDRELRLECLRLADPLVKGGRNIKQAQICYDFLMGNRGESTNKKPAARSLSKQSCA